MTEHHHALQQPEPTLAELIEQAHRRLQDQTESPLLDAEVLLCHSLGKTRSFLRAWPQHRPSPVQRLHFDELLEKRQHGMPVAYLTGYREFWSREFIVNSDVLIPRPDTELLVELALKLLKPKLSANVLDLGTGSGILAITLGLEFPWAKVQACDVSEAALKIARLNAERLDARNVSFIHSHWFDHITGHDFDLIISNPPYIAKDDPHLQRGDVRFEPQTALISADSGLKDIETLANQSRNHLKPGGSLLIEHGYDQQQAVQAIFRKYGYCQTTTHEDLSANPRVTSGLWSPS